MPSKLRVYVSGPLDDNLLPRHQQFRHAILDYVVTLGFEPRGFYGHATSDGYDWNRVGISSLIDRCHGMLVLAFPRWQLRDLVEGAEAGLATTEYAHVEGLLAVDRSKPLLIIRDEAVSPRGILSTEWTNRAIEIPHDVDVDWLEKPWIFKQGVGHWAGEVRKSRDVFLGYCGKAAATADKVRLFLQDEGVSVLDWRSHFMAGENIFEQIREAARWCSCGIFLFTKDDELGGDGEPQTGPRDNVLFEAGFFASAKGKSRTLIILEKGTKFPADLGGDVYLPLEDRNNIGSIETPLRKKLKDIGIL
jgi:hypothetical protein